MKFYRFLTIFFILFVLFMSSDLIELNSISKDNTPPAIKIITPTKSQDYIISQPTIKASFYDKNGVDLRSVKLYVNNKDVTNKAQITKNNIEYTPDKKFKRGTQIIKISLCDNAKNKTTIEWYFTVGTPIYKNFIGNFIDTENIDKIYKNDEFYRYSDYCILYNSNSVSKKTLTDFENNIKNTMKNNFISFNAYKFNINSSEDEISIYNNEEKYNDKNISKLNIEKLYKNLFYSGDFICSFNPKSNNINSFDYMKFSNYGDSIMSLIDITNKSSNLDSPFYLDIYNQALDNGWHISPISTKFITKILSTDLNKDSLLNGLKNRRTYVTNNPKLNLEFTINNSHMGSIIANPSKLNFNISAIDSPYKNKIKKIYIISNNNETIKNINCNSYLSKYEFTLKEFDKYSYYYLVIIQENNYITVSAPIWIESK
ncbi:MAG: hypothetical protein Q4E31_10450 [Intestinibacter bartlettii]|uniref:hypothetical protein n=1 Tax=Intestinibacter bartlettii TaxID=261299 RepID=UPI0026EA9569|nr:hypothetical protein [Intestinibacter bartlettii]MDO5011234.1 hypothetical protein [Intestinibacter bartlettii]